MDSGQPVVVLDNLSTAARVIAEARLRTRRCGRQTLVARLIGEHGIDAIVHFAGSIVVPDSVADPVSYYANNTMVALNLIEAAVKASVGNFIFSSTATVYAGATPEPLYETLPTGPVSPYGRSKLMTEWMLEDAARAYGLRHVILRYFNVAGADPKGRSGQSSPRATHLIKRAAQVALGRVPHLDIFGTDYPTADGTGVRDYIHITDLVEAHVLALEYLRGGGCATTMNCGYGAVHRCGNRDRGRTRNRQSVASPRSPRRAGDPPWLVSDPSLIKKTLGWTPAHDSLDEIVASAYAWERRLNAAG